MKMIIKTDITLYNLTQITDLKKQGYKIISENKRVYAIKEVLKNPIGYKIK